MTYTPNTAWRDLGAYGSGADGNVVISSNTTLTRIMEYNTLVVNSGVILNTDGFFIYALTSITVDGLISCPAGSNFGGAGGGGSKSVGTSSTPGLGGNGGSGGSGHVSSGGGGGSASKGRIMGAMPWAAWGMALKSSRESGTTESSVSAFQQIRGGAGGGGGGTDDNFAGGGGGGNGGGLIILASPSIALNASPSIRALGGNGSDGGSSGLGTGGGGGGGGGGVLLIYKSQTGSGTFDLAGGVGGLKGPQSSTNTTNGSSGSAGTVLRMIEP